MPARPVDRTLAGMSILEWSDALALQQPQMDATHQEFVDHLAALRSALDDAPGALASALRAMVAHTEAHFAQEEAWMARLGFTPENCHSHQHQHVLKVMREVERLFLADGNPRFARQLADELAQWFPVHASTMDAGLAQVMADCGYDPESGHLQRTLAEALSGCGSLTCSD